MPQNTAPMRETEGSRKGAIGRGKSAAVAEARNLGGRPKGSKNKPKSLVPSELAERILLTMEGQLPQDHFEYMKNVIKRGDAVSTKRELDVLILLLNRNLWPALVAESEGEERVQVDGERGTVTKTSKQVVFRKDVTERLKVLNSLLALRNQIEKGEKEDNDGEQPLLRIFGDRAVADRIGILVGVPSSGIPRDPDGTERGPTEAGTVPDQVPQRQLALSSGQQE